MGYVYSEPVNTTNVGTKFITAFQDRFAYNEDNGSYKLKADGMPRRFGTREQQYMTKKENRLRNLEVYNRADVEEMMTQRALATWISRGFKIREEETVEEFIERCNQFHSRI